MSDLLLGIDCGSTVTKVAVFDLDGAELGNGSSRTESRTLPGGGVERATDDIWSSVVAAVRACLSDSGVDPAAIAGIGCSGHGNGLYALDRRGVALPTAYQSLDTRAAAIVGEWDEHGLDAQLFEDAWQRAWPGQPLALLAWLRRNEPDTYEAIDTVLLCKDFVNYRLTDRAASEPTDATAAGLLVNAELVHNAALLERLGMEDLAGRLPELVPSTEVMGTLTAWAADGLGLPAGIPVVGGLFDVTASAIGSGGAAGGSLSVVVGTWSINSVVTREPLIDRGLLMTTAFADARRWMAIEASATSAANLEWYANQVWVDDATGTDAVGGSVFDRCCSAAAATEPRLSGPLYHPFLYGSPGDPRARAGFYGVAGNHTRAEVARAVLEGVVFGHKRHIDELLRAGARPSRVRLTGGGARSEVWSQMFADVLAMPVDISDAEEAGARGAALAAGVGVGVYRDIDEAMERATSVTRSHVPDPMLDELYGRRYVIWSDLIETMRPAWRALAESADGKAADAQEGRTAAPRHSAG